MPGLHALKTGLGNPVLQSHPVGSVADKNQNRVGQYMLDLLEAVGDKVEILFTSKTAHIQDNRCVRAGSPVFTQFLRALMRTEETRIDPAGEQAKPLEPVGGQALDQVIGRNKGTQSAVVKPAQPSKDDWLKQTEPIVLSIAVEIRVETGNDRYIEFSCNAQGTPPQGTFGGDMDEVGGVGSPKPADTVKGGQAEPEF